MTVGESNANALFERAKWELGRAKAGGLKPAGVQPVVSIDTAGRPVAAPYDRFSQFYASYETVICPNYPPFVRALRARYEFGREVAIDLACGSGGVTEALADDFKFVTGIDSSQAMLSMARERLKRRANVSLTLCPFDRFRLDKQADLVICASDSLNYTHDAVELAGVFASVARALRPGGLFVFDVCDSRFFLAASGKRVTYELPTSVMSFSSFYDQQTRFDRSYVEFDDCVEEHLRMAIDREDVESAMQATGLTVVEAFREAVVDGVTRPLWKPFYVLRRTN